jgi:hypothetical protein
MPKKIDDLMGNTYPERIWHSYMESIHQGLEDRGFEEFFDPRPPEDEDEEEEDEETFDGEQMISDEEGFFTSEGDSSIAGAFEIPEELSATAPSNEDTTTADPYEDTTMNATQGEETTVTEIPYEEDLFAAEEGEGEDSSEEGLWYNPYSEMGDTIWISPGDILE